MGSVPTTERAFGGVNEVNNDDEFLLRCIVDWPGLEFGEIY